MTNPFAPPEARVADVVLQRASWSRVLVIVAGCALLGLALSWVAAPTLAGLAVQGLGGSEAATDTPFLVLDLLLSIAAFFVACRLAIRWASGRAWPAAGGVAAIGTLVFLVARGGVAGMVNGDFPLWYEFFPSHILSAALALWVALPHRAPEGAT